MHAAVPKVVKRLVSILTAAAAMLYRIIRIGVSFCSGRHARLKAVMAASKGRSTERAAYFAVNMTLAIVFSHSSFSSPVSLLSFARVIRYVSMGAGGLLIFIGTRPRS